MSALGEEIRNLLEEHQILKKANSRLSEIMPEIEKHQRELIPLERQMQKEFEDVERVLIREEVSGREKSLSSTAKQAGVVNYAFFQNAGYLGMYNMNLSQLRTRRGLPGSVTPLDYMGKTELAGNLFRITQTEEKIKNEKIKGQQSLEIAAKEVGKKVRKTMIEISNVAPENLPKPRILMK